MQMSKWLRSEYDESYLDLIISMDEKWGSVLETNSHAPECNFLILITISDWPTHIGIVLPKSHPYIPRRPR